MQFFKQKLERKLLQLNCHPADVPERRKGAQVEQDLCVLPLPGT